MKVWRNIRGLLLMLCFLAALFCRPGEAAADSGTGVYDFYGLLDRGQEAELEDTLFRLREAYRFDTAILVTEDVWGDDRQYAAEFMQEYGVGYGAERNGMCLLHQPDSRNITVVFRGDAQKAFGTEVQETILDDCAERLQVYDYCGAYEAALADLEKGLVRFSEGKRIRPMDMGGPGLFSFLLMCLGGSFLVMVVPSFLLLWHQRSRMRTITPQPNADFYAPENGVELLAERDIFIRSAVTRTKLPPPSSGGKGSGGGSFTAGGESFSGSGRKY